MGAPLSPGPQRSRIDPNRRGGIAVGQVTFYLAIGAFVGFVVCFNFVSLANSSTQASMQLPLALSTNFEVNGLAHSTLCHEKETGTNSTHQESPRTIGGDTIKDNGDGSHCANLFADFNAGRFVDPNKESPPRYERLTITEPPFWISLHSPEIDNVRWSIMTHGRYYEFLITDNAKEIFTSQKGSSEDTGRGIFVDVGMNIGWYSLLARAMGMSVVGFEPNPANRLRFCESLKLNGWTDVGLDLNISGYGLGESEGIFSLVADSNTNPGAGLLVAKGVGARESQTMLHDTVKVVKLDDYARDAGWFETDAPPIALLKVDVEGKDQQVIFGAEKLIHSGKILNVFFEYSCGHKRKERHMKRVSALFESANYTIANIGIWDGSPKKGYERVLNGQDGDISTRLWDFCREPQKRDSLNMWWSLER